MSERLKYTDELPLNIEQAITFAYEANQYFDGWKQAESEALNPNLILLRRDSFKEALRKSNIFFERAGIAGPDQPDTPEVAAT